MNYLHKLFPENNYNMQCERLIKQAKTWYIHVREETMAPARMISFIEKHVASCDICQNDPDIQDEIAKITEIILPESKIPKAVRQQADKEEPEEEDTDGEEETTDSDEDSGEDTDKDEVDDDFDAEPDLIDDER